MTEPSKGVSVSTTKDEVYVRVAGRGTFQNSQSLRRYSMEMIDRGCQDFVVDLGQCQGMDSTFLGVLAGIGLRLIHNGRSGKVAVINANAHNVGLLQTLGLDRLFIVNTDANGGGHRPPPESEFHKLPDSDIAVPLKPLNKGDTAGVMLEAHENLIRADARNVDKFRDVTRTLRERVAQTPAQEQKPDTNA